MEVVALTGSRPLFDVRTGSGSGGGCRSGLREECNGRGGVIKQGRGWEETAVPVRCELVGMTIRSGKLSSRSGVCTAIVELQAAQPAHLTVLSRGGSGGGVSCELRLKASERRQGGLSSQRAAAVAHVSSSSLSVRLSLFSCKSGEGGNGRPVQSSARRIPRRETSLYDSLFAAVDSTGRRCCCFNSRGGAHRRAGGGVRRLKRHIQRSTTVSTTLPGGSIGEESEKGDSVNNNERRTFRRADVGGGGGGGVGGGVGTTTKVDNGIGGKTRAAKHEYATTPYSETGAAEESERGEAAYQKQFVRWFRESWPYIQEHRGCTFVVVIPGSVVSRRKTFYGILQDVALLHGLGIRMLLVVGASDQIDELLRQRGAEASFVSGYRVTDEVALEAAMEAAGRIRVDIEAKLSRGPAIPMLRRHGENDRWHDVGISVSSGNYVAAKRRGVVDGVDFGATGEVKKVDIARIKERLNSGCVVMLSNLGYSSTGDVLNCNTYDVARAAAVSSGADKLLCMIDGPVLGDNGRIIKWMTLQKGEELIREQGGFHSISSASGHHYHPSSVPSANMHDDHGGSKNGPLTKVKALQAVGPGGVNGHIFPQKLSSLGLSGLQHGPHAENGGGIPSSKSTCLKYLPELATAVDACMGGVRRVHLIDSSIEGALLLELYTRDGMGTMISNDMYEGMRAARRQDLEAINNLLAPLEQSGVLVKRTENQLLQELPYYTVIERDANIIACAALFPFFQEKCAEVAAFVVSPECRGHGLGDNLLAYLEKHAAEMGLERLFLLTTRTADWFVQRGFVSADSSVIPEDRRARINLQRNSKYFVKHLKETPSPVGLASSRSHTSMHPELKFYQMEDDDDDDDDEDPFSSCSQSGDTDPLGEFEW